jgi:hypothetical protein
MSGKHKGWRYPQLEIFVERALASDGSAAGEVLAAAEAWVEPQDGDSQCEAVRGKDMERVTKLHLDEPCPHIPKEITAPFHCTACVLEYLKIERGDAS